MDIEADYILGAIAIGIGATLVMDLWNLFLKRTFSIPSLNYCLLGRWLRHLAGGTLRHASITAAPQKPFECTVGWIAHYKALAPAEVPADRRCERTVAAGDRSRDARAGPVARGSVPTCGSARAPAAGTGSSPRS